MDGRVSGSPLEDIAWIIISYVPGIGNLETMAGTKAYNSTLTERDLIHFLLVVKLDRPTECNFTYSDSIRYDTMLAQYYESWHDPCMTHVQCAVG